jgi:hypothetical protein
VRDLQSRHLRDVPGQQAALQGDGRVVLAGVQAGVVDGHCRPCGQVAGQPQVGFAVRLGVFRPGEDGHPQGDAPGDQRHHHERVHTPGEDDFRMTGREGGLPAYLGRIPRQEGFSPPERHSGRTCERRGEQIADLEATRGPGRGVAHLVRSSRSWKTKAIGAWSNSASSSRR